MKILIRKTLIILTMLMVTLSVMPLKPSAEMQESVQSNAINADNPEKKAASSSDTQKEIVGEDTSKREENIKHFILKDHTYEADVYPYPVHYKVNGKWEDIDNTLADTVDTDTNDQVLENKDNQFKVHFAKKTSKNNLVKIKSGNFVLAWNLENIQDTQVVKDKQDLSQYNSLTENEKTRTLKKLETSVTYPNVFTKTDLQYKLISGEIKENLILNDVPETTEFTFDYHVKNLKAKLEDNKVIFYNQDNPSDERYVINAPYMYDAKGEESTDINLKLQDDGDSYKVILSPNKEWLQSPNRQYPVVIDPTVETSVDPKDIADANVSQSYPTTNYQVSDMLKVGKGSTSGINQTFIKFNKLPTISSANVITSATLDLKLYSDNTAGSQVNIHKVTKDWSSDTVTWNTKPTIDSTKIQDYQNVKGTAGDEFVWDITSIAKQWYTDQQNYGLMLKADDETANYTEFFSSDVSSTYSAFRPIATFDYVNNSGLEDYWTYHSQDVGRAGTGYVNDYSGNLVFTHDDLDMDGSRMPVSISHVFNSNDRQVDNKYGNGWRLNFSQRVDLDSKLDQYYYTDEDGTKHYFDFDSDNNIYNDESGLDLSMTIDTASTTERYKIKDKGGDQLSFNSSGYLTFIRDNNNNTITLGYSGTYLVSATDGAGRATTLKRDPGTNNLTQIIDPSGRITSYTYTGTDLTKITYPDGKSSSYTYDANHNLTEAKNFDGYRINYTYYPNSPYRVSKSTESNIDSNQVVTNGQSLQFTYGKNTTSFVDNIGRKEIYQFNNNGNTVSTKDPDGNAEYYKYSSGTNVNKLSAASKPQKTTINYLLNHNAEKTTDWTTGNDSGSTGSQSFATDDAYIGNQSLKVTKTNNVNAHYYTQTVTLTPGKTYTYSGYVKTSNVTNTNKGGAALYLTYQDKAGTSHTVTSSYVTGTNDWDRKELNFTLPSDTTYKNVNIRVGIVNETGTAYFDALQLEDGKVPSRYNLVENPDLTYGTTTPSYWSTTGSASLFNYTTQSGEPSNLNSNVMGITGDPTQNLNLYQVIEVNGKKGDALTIGGWGKGDSVPITYPRYFAIDLGIKRTDGTYQWFTAYFNEDSSDWQYTSGVAIADSDFTEVKVYGLYYQNENKAYFDGFQLYLEPFEDNFSYDSNGNITSSKDTKSEKSTYSYSSSNDLTEYVDSKGNTSSYNYDQKHNLLSTVSAKDIMSSFTYDSYGNTTGTSNQSADQSLSVENSTAYTADGNYVSKITDASGNPINYNYDLKNGTLKDFTDPNNSKTSYTYDSNTDVVQSVSKTVDQQTILNAYEYQNDDLSKITANGTSFGFKYDVFGNNTETTVGSKSIVSNSYDNSTHLLQSSQFNQGDKIYYGYDDNTDRVTYKSLNKSPKSDSSVTPNFSYDYDNNGNLSLLTDNDNNVSYRYYYDILDRITKVKDSFGNYFKYTYDPNDNVTKNQFGTANNLYTTTYSYDKDNKQTSVVYNQPYVNDSRIETFFNNGSTTSSNETRPITNNATFSQDPDRGTVLSAYEGTTNLIPSNPSFETGTTGWTITDWSALSGGGRISQDSTDGSQSLEFYDKNKQANPTNAVAYETYTYTSPITAAKTVTFSAMAKRIGGTNPTLSIRCYDSTGTDIPGGYVSINQPISSNEWTKISQVFTVPANTKSFKILLRGAPKGSDLVRFDQVQLEEKPFATTYTDTTSTGTKLQYNLGLSSAAGTQGVWFNTKTTNTNRTILANEKSGAGIANISIGTDNKVALTVKNNAGTSVTYKSTAPVVAANTWNLATLHWTKSGSTITFKLGVNGKEDIFAVTDWKDFTDATTSVGSSATGTLQLNGDIDLMTYSPTDIDVSTWSSTSGSEIDFNYDSLGRPQQKVMKLATNEYTTAYTYKQGLSSGKTTYLVDSYTNGTNSPISYSYDKLGNIKTITENGKTITYSYNELSELLREDNNVAGQTVVYTYDVGGNHKTKNVYDYTDPAQSPTNPTKTYTYHYDDKDWHDLLTSIDTTTYNGGTPTTVTSQVQYDANLVGNPTSYDGNTLTWTWGKELKSFSNANYDVTYSYNENGIRTKKIVKNKQDNSTITTSYIVDGDQVVFESDGTNKIHYTYDSEGDLLSLNLNGTEYYYLTNIQGDITGLLDESGNQVVSYQYDSWGNSTSISGSLKDTVGKLNPYRYRGYRYDTETNLYYLQSRYYNSEWGRFINADDNVGKNGELLTHNMFAYARNNPVNHIDLDGEYVLDTIFLITDAGAFIANPTIGGAGWVLLDMGSYVDPTGIGSSAIHALKGAHTAEEALRAAKAAGHTSKLYDASKLSFKSGTAGEKFLQKMVGGGGHKHFKIDNPKLGKARIVDVYYHKIAYESKVGYCTLTKFVKKQIQKDYWLIHNGEIKGAEWVFFRSSITGKVGASKNLLEYLEFHHIKYKIVK
ncbi:DNRLRE domain-containing protein [Gottfriedia sp. NPDC057991]|uniref:DNRLRE domain-containing protein n=1 Tax=Gottfriedia sp. NPDC057991 TaxID=3346298 RepID=UPI0036DDACF8